MQVEDAGAGVHGGAPRSRKLLRGVRYGGVLAGRATAVEAGFEELCQGPAGAGARSRAAARSSSSDSSNSPASDSRSGIAS